MFCIKQNKKKRFVECNDLHAQIPLKIENYVDWTNLILDIPGDIPNSNIIIESYLYAYILLNLALPYTFHRYNISAANNL